MEEVDIHLLIYDLFTNLRRKNEIMKISDIAFNKIKEFEGLRTEAYLDAAGVLTIGYGHTGSDVRAGDRISEYYAGELLREDVEKVEREVERLQVAHTQGQLDALVSLAMNIGVGRLRKSRLVRLIRRGGSYREIKAEFKRWVFAGGRRLPGLVTRRQWEAERFFEAGRGRGEEQGGAGRCRDAIAAKKTGRDG